MTEVFDFDAEVMAQQPLLRRQAVTLCRSPHRADDLVQEAICIALENRHKWEGKGPLGAWIYAIMRNKHYASFRNSSKEVDDPEGIILDNTEADGSVDDEVEARDTLAHTLEAIKRLPEESRILLQDIAEGLSYEEIAVRRGLSVGAVKSRVQRGRLSLRETIYLEAIPVSAIPEAAVRNIVGISPNADDKPAILASAHPEMGAADPNTLMVEPAYQRDLSGSSIKLIRKIVNNWDWTKFKPPICARTEVGLFVIDGQHTAIAAASHPEISSIPIMIVSADYIAERAAAFVSHNRDRLAMTPAQIFYGDLAAGDEAAKGIMEVIVTVGAAIPRLPPAKGEWKAGQISAIGELRAAWKGVKRDKFERILRIAVKTGAAPVSKTLLRGLRSLASETRFKDAWGNPENSIIEGVSSIPDLEASSEQYAVNLGISRFSACAEMIAEGQVMNAMPGGGEFGRGARVDVRNPIVLLPEAQALAATMTPEQRRAFGDLMRAMAREADKQAEKAWRKRKGPMAAYWRAGCTYMKHIARAIDPRSTR